jgi:hypothetical protein
MKLLLPILLLISATSFSQSADFIQLKKKNKPVTTFYSGMNISLTAQSGANINALINGIQNDTLYLQEFIIQYLPTTFGTYIIDTVGSYRYKYHYNQIAAIGKKENTNFNTKGSGAALFGGGVLLTLASGVVYVVDRKKFSAPLLLASVGLGTLGYFLAKGKKGGSGMVIGKKYKLVYINMSNKKTLSP